MENQLFWMKCLASVITKAVSRKGEHIKGLKGTKSSIIMANEMPILQAGIKGSPCLKKLLKTKGWNKHAQCCNLLFHPTGIYVRLDHPDIFDFLQETLTNSEMDEGTFFESLL